MTRNHLELQIDGTFPDGQARTGVFEFGPSYEGALQVSESTRTGFLVSGAGDAVLSIFAEFLDDGEALKRGIFVDVGSGHHAIDVDERGVDYELHPNAGEIQALSTGAITDGEQVVISYDRHIVGEYESPDYDGTYAALEETLPAVTTQRYAEHAVLTAVRLS